jgi:hypothetical protein
MTVNVNDLTFGIEIECCLPAGTVATIGAYHRGAQIPQLPPGWNAQRDCSIQAPAGHQAIEVVSPVLKGAEGVRQVLAVLKWLNEAGARVNRSTGFHVHVGWKPAWDNDTLARLVHLVSNHEKAIYASTGTHSREEGHFCQSVRNDQTYQAVYRDGTSNRCIGNRYHVLNLTNLGSRQTVEFRAFAGTTNATKVLGHIMTCLALVEKAPGLKREPKWVAKKPVETSPINRKGGEGQTELTRFFYSMGWTKGREEHTFGHVTAEGAPALAEVKKELMRLAKKYDTRQE